MYKDHTIDLFIDERLLKKIKLLTHDDIKSIHPSILNLKQESDFIICQHPPKTEEERKHLDNIPMSRYWGNNFEESQFK